MSPPTKIGFYHATSELDVHWFPSLAYGYLKSYLADRSLGTISMVRLRSADEVKDCDVVAISSTSQDYEIAGRFARDAKQIKQGVITVLGGHHVTYLPRTMSREFDFGVLGEGEETFLELVRHLRGGVRPDDQATLRDIRGLAYHGEAGVQTTSPRPPIAPLDRLPHPCREAATAPFVLTSRGCPYRCSFCTSSAFWGKPRFFSADYVVEEIEQILQEYPGARTLSIQDDLFIADADRFDQIVDLLLRRGVARKVSFSFAVRANLVTDELCRRIKDLRVDAVCFGAESGCDRILDNMRKGTTVAQNQEALDLLYSHGIPAVCSFIVGWPTETAGEVRSTYEFLLANIRARKLTPDSVVNVLTPMPGTEVWRKALQAGAVAETGFSWRRLGVFAAYRHSNSATLSDWVDERRSNDSVYLDEGTLPREELYKIMKEYDDRIRAVNQSPEPSEPFPLVFPESVLAHKYCVGQGLEIGGSAHNPFGLDARNVDMTDSLDTVFKREEVRLCGRALPVDIVASGDALPCADESQDFIVSSHVLEHFPDPIKALLEWDRLVRPGGIIFMIVPHKERTFDREKPRTPLQHLIDDFRSGNTQSHGDQNGHDHCWVTEDLLELIRWMIANLGLQWDIAEVQDRDDKVGNGFTVVIRKRDVGTAVLLARVERLVANTRETLRAIAEASQQAHLPVAALAKAMKALSREALSPKAALELGELCFSVELYELASAFFHQALRADPGNADTLNDLGVFSHRIGDIELSRDLFLRALQAQPENAEALSNLTHLSAQP